MDEWLNQVSELPGELIETDRFAMVAEAFVKKTYSQSQLHWPVIILVQDAIQKIVSSVIGSEDPKPRLPEA